MAKQQVPDLRFEGLEGEWEVLTLGDVSERSTVRNTEQFVVETFTNSAQFGIVSQLDYFDHSVSNPDNIGSYFVVEPNDFVYNPRISTLAPFGPVNRNKLGRVGAMSPLYSVFRPTDIEHGFLEYFFKTSLWHRFMKMHGDSGARHDRFSIGVEDFFKLEFARPPVEEQRAVGRLFANLDSLLNEHRHKHQHLKQTKTALMQRMFPQGDAVEPALRYQGFIGSWKRWPLLSVIASITDFRGRTPKKLGLDWSRSGYLALSANNVKHGYIDLRRDPRFGDDKLYEKWMSGRELHEGQVLFTTEAPMGNVAQVPDSRKYILSQRVIAFVVKDDLITDGFLGVALGTPAVFAQLKSLLSGGTAQGVSQRSLAHLMLAVPESLEEQDRLARFFSKFDTLIAAEQQYIEKLQQAKAALLQKMFV